VLRARRVVADDLEADARHRQFEAGLEFFERFHAQVLRETVAQGKCFRSGAA